MLLLVAASFPFSRDESTQWVVLAAGVVATLYVIMRSKSRVKRVDPLARQSTGIGLSQQRQVERDINNLMVEMLETARQMTAQLDTRAAKLELLIRQADERLAALKSTPANASAIPNLGNANRPADDPHPDDSAPDSPPVVPAPASESTPEPVETPPDPRHAEIYALADQGRTPWEIARSLDRPNGEVELILALRRR
jgi:hypothetical protein